MRIWVTEYAINPYNNLGTMCGPNIEAPTLEIAQQKCEELKSEWGSDLRIQGRLIMEIPTKIDPDHPERETFDPDWDNAIDYDTLASN